jgi:hypothetical protein
VLQLKFYSTDIGLICMSLVLTLLLHCIILVPYTILITNNVVCNYTEQYIDQLAPSRKKMYLFFNETSYSYLWHFISAMQFSPLEHKVNTNTGNNFSMKSVLFYKYLSYNHVSKHTYVSNGKKGVFHSHSYLCNKITLVSTLFIFLRSPSV